MLYIKKEKCYYVLLILHQNVKKIRAQLYERIYSSLSVPQWVIACLTCH